MDPYVSHLLCTYIPIHYLKILSQVVARFSYVSHLAMPPNVFVLKSSRTLPPTPPLFVGARLLSLFIPLSRSLSIRERAVFAQFLFLFVFSACQWQQQQQCQCFPFIFCFLLLAAICRPHSRSPSHHSAIHTYVHTYFIYIPAFEKYQAGRRFEFVR